MDERAHDDRDDSGEYTDADPQARKTHDQENGDYTDVQREDGSLAGGDDGVDGEYTDTDRG